MLAYSCTPMWTWADSGGMGYTFLPTRVKSQPYWLLPTCKPSSLRPRSGPHHGLQHQTQLWNLPRPKAPVARVGITVAWDTAPTHPPQSALNPPQPRSLPVPRSQPQKNRISLPRIVTLASVAVSPPHLPNQLGVSRKRPMQKSPANSTPPSPLAPVGLMAFAVQWGPTVRQPGSSLPPSPQPPWVLAHLDNGDLHPKKVGTCWLHFILAQASTFQDTQ